MAVRYEMKINILDNDTIDNLIVALVRNGYSVYMSDESFDEREKSICFTVNNEDLTPIEETSDL